MCPECKSIQVRRSHRRGTGERIYSWIWHGQCPYRCDHCGTRFWISKKIVDKMIFEAANADTKNVLQAEALAFKSSDKAFRKSQVRNQSKYQLRRWIWRRTRLELETVFMLLLLGTVVLVGVWISIGKI